ncbi:MAG: copper chaperone PCu(A)C [Paracoccaceae bacterium]|nr:copper chaperone PCu(A)C [Paracoccaceae bacterium]
MKSLLPFAAALTLATAAHAADQTAGALTFVHPHAAATRPAQLSDAGYLTIRNNSDQPDYLTGVSAVFADAELHVSKVDANGISSMAPVASLEIPAHGAVDLKPGGNHIMMMGLSRVLKQGTTVPITLTFKNAGKVTVSFMIDGGASGATKMDMTAPAN